MSRRPLSLQARALLAASFALAAFLGLAGFALDQAIYGALRNALHDRLQSYIYGYLGGSDTSRGGKLIPPELPPDPRFNQPGSGLYAGVIGEKNHWLSPSATGKELPFEAQLKPNETRFVGPLETAAGRVYQLSLGVTYEVPNRGSVPLTFHVAEDASVLEAQLEVFRNTLLIHLGAAAVLLLIMQMVVLRWSLRPLRRITSDLARVERGEQSQLAMVYPPELAGLAGSLNDFILSERERLSRYRNTLADLAHSLKTPLAVMHAQLEDGGSGDQFRWTVLEQVGRMDQIVAYQLSRAVTSGHQTFVTPIALAPPIEEIVQSLEKVYSKKNILCEFDIDDNARFYGEHGDLLELLGNLLENAFKWAKRRVLVTARELKIPGARRPGLEILVEDDGPGIPQDQVDHLLQRGVRGDERVQGHGIGLSIVQDILKAYRGELEVKPSTALHGAAFCLRFTAN